MVLRVFFGSVLLGPFLILGGKARIACCPLDGCHLRVPSGQKASEGLAECFIAQRPLGQIEQIRKQQIQIVPGQLCNGRP